MLSFLTYRRWMSEVKGLDAFPQQDWPDNIPLLYYSYHVMVGLGTIFIAIMVLCRLEIVEGDLVHLARNALGPHARASLPLHRQYRRLDHRRGGTPTLGHLWPDAHRRRACRRKFRRETPGSRCIGFMGMYTVLSILFLFLVYRVSSEGPEPPPTFRRKRRAVREPPLRLRP